MKKTILVLSIIAAALIAACSEWTEPQALPIERPSADAENPALYQQYLENLRNYKMTYHPLLIGWFDNSDKSFSGRASHLKAVPDKVDILSLLYPDNLATVEQEEMAAIRADKGTRVIYTIDYEAFLNDLNARNEEIALANEDSMANNPDFVPVPLLVLAEELPGFMDRQLALLDKYGYDGLTIYYNGQSSALMTPEQKAELQALQDVIFSRLTAVMQRNPAKTFLFEGRPDFLLDKSILPLFDYIVVRTETKTSIPALEETVLNILVSDVPGDNIIVCALPFSRSSEDTKTGRILDEAGTTQHAIVEIARWVTVSGNFTRAGLGVYRINDDYFNPDIDYRYVREAIEIMNPSPKN